MPSATAGLPTKPEVVSPGSEFSPDELQELVYLRASGQISESEALKRYDELLHEIQHQGILKKILRELFPSLGLQA